MALICLMWGLSPLPTGWRNPVKLWSGPSLPVQLIVSVRVISPFTAMLVSGHGPHWSGPWPGDCLPGQSPDLPRRCACLAATGLCLDPHQTRSWPDLGHASSPWACLRIQALGWTWLPCPGLPCSSLLGYQGPCPASRVLPPAPGSLSFREQPVLTAPWWSEA